MSLRLSRMSLGILLVFFTGTQVGRAAIIMTSFTPEYVGIDYAHGEATPGGSELRLQKVDVLRIDLQAPGIRFITTPQSGPLDTVSQKGSEFVTTQGVQAAINASFFSLVTQTPHTNQDLSGLAISQGNLVSAPAAGGFASSVLAITQTNVASFVTTTAGFDTTGIYNAVAGSQFILENGVNLGGSPTSTDVNPRSLAGISQDGRYLFLMTIDGRQPGYSMGANYYEAAAWLQRFGAASGLNLDGGGSTELLTDHGPGGFKILNSPVGYTIGGVPQPGLERYDGNFLGVYANALPVVVPEPSPLCGTVLSCCAWHCYRRRLCRIRR